MAQSGIQARDAAIKHFFKDAKSVSDATLAKRLREIVRLSRKAQLQTKKGKAPGKWPTGLHHPRDLSFGVAAVVISITPEELAKVASITPPKSPYTTGTGTKQKNRNKVPLLKVLDWKKDLKAHKRLKLSQGNFRYGYQDPSKIVPFVTQNGKVLAPLMQPEQLQEVLLGQQDICWMSFVDVLTNAVWADHGDREAWAAAFIWRARDDARTAAAKLKTDAEKLVARVELVTLGLGTELAGH